MPARDSERLKRAVYDKLQWNEFDDAIDAITNFARSMAFTARNESILSLNKYIDMNINDKITNINKTLTEMKTTLDNVTHAMTHIGTDDMKDDHRSKIRIDNELRYNNHITFVTVTVVLSS